MLQKHRFDYPECCFINYYSNPIRMTRAIAIASEMRLMRTAFSTGQCPCPCATRCTSIYKGLATFHITCLWHCGMRHRGGRTVIQARWWNVGSRSRNVKGNAESDEQGRNVPKSASVADCSVVALKCL